MTRRAELGIWGFELSGALPKDPFFVEGLRGSRAIGNLGFGDVWGVGFRVLGLLVF